MHCFLAALLTARAQVNVTTYHNDNARTGQNLNESILTPAAVNPNQFGKLFTQPVDGYIYAQPLYVSNLQIAGGVHSVVFVATEHDSVYAFDADSNAGPNGSPLWKVSFINPAAGITTLDSFDDTSCSDLVPEIGITGTPVIDLPSKALYVVVRTKENGVFVQRLHTLDITTGAEKFGGPVVIQASVPGTGDGSSGGQVPFDPLHENQRPGLLLQNGLVYITWASHCDHGPYHGWAIAYNAQSLQQVAVRNATPNGGDGGIWQSGAAPAADSSGNVFLATGNGTYDLNTGGADAGDSIVKLGPPSGANLPLLDYFTPFNQSSLNAGDVDLGSGGVLLLPDLPGGSAHQHLLAEVGKQGTIYLVDRDAMGHFNPSDDTQIVQSLPGAVTGVWGMPAFWNNTVYVGGESDHLKAFSFNDSNSGLLSIAPVSASSGTYHYPGTTPAVSASGSVNGILWALDYISNGSAVLHAYDATNLANELYNTTQKSQDAPGPAVKFAVPTIANGKVYVGTATQLAVYGITAALPAVPALLSPANGATGIDLTPALTWSPSAAATSYNIYFGTSSPPAFATNTAATSYSPASLSENATYFWEIVATTSYGSAASPIWSFSTVTCPPTVIPSAVFLDSANQSASINVSAAPSCAWSASATGGFIGITSGASGTGSGVVTIAVPANNTGAALAGTLTIGGQVVSVTQRESTRIFADVNPPDYYFDFANLIYTSGITAGCLADPREYCPSDTITRGETAVFLVTSVEGGNNFTYTTTPYFTDVPPSDPFFKFIQKLRELGITIGCSATEFCPGDPVTRAEMAAFIIRARYETTPYTYPSNPYFTDVPASYLFFPFIQKMAQSGITAGCALNLYCPDSTLTRGQMAVFIVTGLLNQLLPAGTPLVAKAVPDSVFPGQAVTVTLTGANTHFAEGTTQVITSAGITPSNIAVTSATDLTVQFAVAPGATPRPYSIVVTTETEEAVLPNGFTVQSLAPGPLLPIRYTPRSR